MLGEHEFGVEGGHRFFRHGMPESQVPAAAHGTACSPMACQRPSKLGRSWLAVIGAVGIGSTNLGHSHPRPIQLLLQHLTLGIILLFCGLYQVPLVRHVLVGAAHGPASKDTTSRRGPGPALHTPPN